MKKIALLLSLTIILALILSACGGTTAATPAPAEKFRVAVVMPSAINDLAFSQSMYDALMRVQKDMGGPDKLRSSIRRTCSSSMMREATNTFLGALKQIEDRCSDHTEDPDETLLQVKDAVDSVCTACETFEREIRDREMIRDAQVRFREKTDSILSKSYCNNRARTWPQGYQGDYKTLEGIYRNTPLSEGIGFYLDLWGLNISLAVAVRNRIQKLETLLRDELRQRMSPAVMNIACGSCREVFELAADIEKSGARFSRSARRSRFLNQSCTALSRSDHEETWVATTPISPTTT